ncbi:MAG: hypothetical protein ACYDB7_04185 [Mycobacteriales bacterium]
MALQSLAGRSIVTGEDTDDLRTWLSGLAGCPPVTHTVVASCAAETHGEDRPTWFYVEADPDAGVARRRCVACGTVTPLLDSEVAWTHPTMHSCRTCAQSMMEFAVGLHAEQVPGDPDHSQVSWLAVGVRCVGCGRIDGVTDMIVPDLPLGDVAARV